MSFFDDIYQRIFGTASSEANGSVSVEALIKRSPTFLSEYEEWRASEQAAVFLESMWQSFYWQRKGVDKQPVLLLLESKYSNGFSLSYKSSYGKKDFQFLFDYLAQQVQELGYRKVVSKSAIEERGEEVELKEMHYLKPKVGFVEPIDQAFGNIQIEYIEENGQPVRIKFRANSYPDRKYKEARSFEELAEEVLSVNN